MEDLDGITVEHLRYHITLEINTRNSIFSVDLEPFAHHLSFRVSFTNMTCSITLCNAEIEHSQVLTLLSTALLRNVPVQVRHCLQLG